MSKAPKLIKVRRLDSIALDSTFFTDEGYLIDTPIVTSVGIFEYKNPDGSIRRELRLPKHVFDKTSLASYEGKPAIITHNAGRVDKDNVEDEIVGTILSPGYQDGDDVRAKVIIHNVDVVKNSGLRELSLGYDLVLEETPGTWNGQQYDAIQTNIIVNHLALVKGARAGDHARLNLDSKNQKGANPMGAKRKTVDAAGLQKLFAACKKKGLTNLDEVELVLMKEIGEIGDGDMSTDAEPPSPNDEPGAAAATDALPFEEKVKLIKDKFDSRAKDNSDSTSADYIADVGELLEIIEYLQGRYDSEITLKDNALGGDVAVGDETPSIMNADSVDAIISERLKLGRLGDKLNLDGLEAMKPLDAKKAIIRKINPSMRLDGKGSAYIAAAFDVAVEQLNNAKDTTFQRQQAAGRLDGVDIPALGASSAAQAREKMIERNMNGGDE